MIRTLRYIGGNRLLLFVSVLAFTFFALQIAVPDIALAGTRTSTNEYDTRLLSRGEVVSTVVTSFKLAERKSSFITACRNQLDECFFVFSAMSDFDGISFEPHLSLYPDVTPHSRFYEPITLASMLGLVHGYLSEEETPFRPEIVMSRIQALKIVLGAADLMGWEERFEVSDSETIQKTPFHDDVLTYRENWWYNRYLNFAYEYDIVPETDFFRPDDIVTVAELQEMIQGAQKAHEVREGELHSQSFAISSGA